MPIIATTDSSRSRSIPELRELFASKSIEAIVTPMYKSNDKGNIVDTKKTIIAVRDVADLEKSGLTYQLFDFSRFADPKVDQGQCWQIHVTGFPNTWKRNQAVNFLKSFLEPMFTGWYLSMPTIRETGTVHGYGVITFKDKSFTEDQIRQLKLILHHKALCDPQGKFNLPNTHLRVSWQVEHRTAAAGTGLTNTGNVAASLANSQAMDIVSAVEIVDMTTASSTKRLSINREVSSGQFMSTIPLATNPNLATVIMSAPAAVINDMTDGLI